MSNTEETRSVRVQAMLTPSLRTRLDVFAAARRWPVSTAIEYAVERMLDTEGGDTDDGSPQSR
jgi:hypothetical protein